MNAATEALTEIPEPADNGPGGLFRSGPMAESLGVYLPATIAFRLINFGRILLLSWFMLRQEFGLFTMILLVVNVMTPLCSFGLNDAVTRYVPQNEARGTLAAMVRRSAILLIGVTALSLVPILLFARRLGSFLYSQILSDAPLLEQHARDAADLTRLSAIVIALLAVYFLLLSVLKGLRMFTALSLMEILHGGLFLVFSIGAIAVGEPQALTLTGLYGLSLAAPIVLFGLGLGRVLRAWTGQHGAIDGGGVGRTLLKFGSWATLAGGAWQIMVYFPAWYLNKVHGNDAVAVFAAVRQIGQFVLIGAVALVAVVMSNVAKTWETRGREEADRQLSLAFRGCCLGLLFCCVFVALAKDLIIRMFPPAYEAGARVLPLQLLFFLLAAYLSFLAIHFQLIEKARHLFWPWLAGIVANVVLAHWLAGPGGETVRAGALWKAVSPITMHVFSAGFSDRAGLDSAAWCGVFGVAAALVTCLALLRKEGRGPGRGAAAIILGAVLLATHTWILAVGTTVLLILALGTDALFTREERGRLIALAVGAVRQAPGLRSRRRDKDAD